LKKKKLDAQPANDEEVASTPDEARPSSETPASAVAQDENEGADFDDAAQDDPDAAQALAANVSQATDIQILDLHCQNPVISYQNQIYHCTWSDLVGTAMFFSKTEGSDEDGDLLSTDEFHLINTSRIKLIGQKAKLTAKPSSKRRRQVEEDSSEAILVDVEHDEAEPVGKGKSLGEIRTANPKTNADIKRQAAFLENLMDVKRAKGESDNVRTVFSQRKPNSQIIPPRSAAAKRSRRSQEYPSITAEIEELNRKVVRGDAGALMRLQDIYSSMQDGALDRSSPPQIPLTAGQTPEDDPASADALQGASGTET
jgi:TFIIIC subunit triple barrel domain